MPCSSHDFDWNTDTISRLRSLWTEGYSTADIGRRMGISKNAVVGKSHRLDLPARPSPIRETASANRRRRAVRVAPPCRNSRVERSSRKLRQSPRPSLSPSARFCPKSCCRCRLPSQSVEPSLAAGQSVSRERADSGSATHQTRAANRIAQTIAGSPTAKRNRGRKQPESDLNRGTGDRYGTRVRLLRCKTG